MRTYSARLVFRERGKGPVVIAIDDALVIRRDMSKFCIVCDDGVECYPLGVFDPSISAGDGHAKLFWNGDTLFIQDLGSSNGTFIVIDEDELPLPGWNARTDDDDNDERAPSEPVPIRRTRTVRIGTLAFTVEIEKKRAINVTGDYLATGASKIDVRDSVLQRSTIGGKAGGGGDGGGEAAPTENEVESQVEVHDSVVVRSRVAGREMGICPACGKPVATEWKNCPYCCTALRE